MLPNLKSVALAQYILLSVNMYSYSSKLNSLQKNIDTNEWFQGSIRFNTTKFKGSFGMLSASEHQKHTTIIVFFLLQQKSLLLMLLKTYIWGYSQPFILRRENFFEHLKIKDSQT